MSYLRYPGGKSKVVDEIIAQFPPTVTSYIEPFFGGGSVGLAVAERKIVVGSNLYPHYWVNDHDVRLWNFWRACALSRSSDWTFAINYSHYLITILKRKVNLSVEEKKAEFYRIKESWNKELDYATANPMECCDRAAEFFFVNRCSFSGTGAKGGFSKDAAEKRFTVNSIEKLAELPQKLNGFVFSNVDYKCILEMVKDTDFVYLDPPYLDSKLDLYLGHKDFNHTELARLLQDLPGKWLLSYNNCPAVKELYKDFNIVEYSMVYGMGTDKVGKELLIRNY